MHNYCEEEELDNIQEVDETDSPQVMERMDSELSKANCGFVPMEKDQQVMDEDKSKKRKREEDSPAIKEIKEKINYILSRYPELQPRTSHGLMQKLEAMDLQELCNVHMNLLHDLSNTRGTACAETVIFVLTWPINKTIRGYMSKCLNDDDLKKDIEMEMVDIMGAANSKVNILFRLFNNAVKMIMNFDDHQFSSKSAKTVASGRPIFRNVNSDEEVEESEIESGGRGNGRIDMFNNQ